MVVSEKERKEREVMKNTACYSKRQIVFDDDKTLAKIKLAIGKWTVTS